MRTAIGARVRTTAIGLCIAATFTGAAEATEYRSFDGTNNNLANPGWGAAGAALLRLAPANYADGLGAVDGSRADVRTISNSIFNQVGSRPDQRGLSEWGWVWGQFIDHDIDHTLTSGAAGTLTITIPSNDPYFGDLSPNNTIAMTRSAFTTGADGVRQQINNISAYIDANMVYGGRAVDGPGGVDRVEWLRANDGTGRLKVSDGGALGALLPRWDPTAPAMANTGTPLMGTNAFVAGDVRANENIALIATQTLFLREHNRLADLIRVQNPGWSDDEIYQAARKVVGAEVQAITYYEWLPAMGLDLGAYAGYDPAVNAGVTNEFSAAAFRTGHSQINDVGLRLNADGTVIAAGNLPLAQSFFNPARLAEGGLEPILRGLAAQVQEANDQLMVDGLRNQLFKAFVPGLGLVDNAIDLAALDILRGRDHGLGSYNQTRIALGLAAATSFSDLTSDGALAALLAAIYGGDIGQLDLFVGLMVEDLVAGTSLGATTIALFADQFTRLRSGDRFWYENDLAGINSDLMTLAAIFDPEEGAQSAFDFAHGVTLDDIIRLNSDAIVPGSALFATGVPEPPAFFLIGFALLAWAGLARIHRH